MTDETLNKPHSFVFHLSDEEREALMQLKDTAGLPSLSETIREAVNVYYNLVQYAKNNYDIVAIPPARNAMFEISSTGINNAKNSGTHDEKPQALVRVQEVIGNVMRVDFAGRQVD